MTNDKYFDVCYNYEMYQSKYYKQELFQYLNNYRQIVGQTEFNDGNKYIMMDYLSRMTKPHYVQGLQMIMDYCEYTGMNFPKELTETKQFKQYRLEQRLERINQDFE